jgi:uncharacterized protein YukE
MSDRVLSTAAARAAITQFQRIVNGELYNQINELNAQGQVLSDQNNWDGRLAGEFRAHWQTTHSKLVGIKQALDELRQQVQTINQNIMSAGGNQ